MAVGDDDHKRYQLHDRDNTSTIVSGEDDFKCYYRYVGETSRPLRERAREHRRNMLEWNKESFWLEHWMN